MTIVAMSKLRAIAPQNINRPLMKELTRVGCVEIESSAEHLAEEDWAAVLKKFSDPSDADRRLNALASARELLDKYAPGKSSFLSPRRLISEQEFNDETIVDEACAAVDTINELGRQLVECAGEEGRLSGRKAFLSPWQNLDVPLDVQSGRSYIILFGVSPTTGVPAQDLVNEASSKAPAELFLVNSDREQNYFLLLAHSGQYDEVLDGLKAKGFAVVSFKDVAGTAAENIRQLEIQLKKVEDNRLEIIEKIKGFAGQKAAVEHAIDVFTIENERDKVMSGLVGTQKTLLLEGWIPKEREIQVAEILERYGCAYQFDVPEESENVPVLLQNNRLVTPFTMVTELYSLPSYRSILDPNPFMTPFFIIFFGMMTGDISYGIMITLTSWYILKRSRPAAGSTIQRILQLAFICGISGAIWGVLFGGLFGNAISAIGGAMFGLQTGLKPILFDPMAEPTSLFILALAFGFIHICFGLCLNAYQSIKRNRITDAVCDVGFHLLIIVGAPLCLLNTNAGLTIMAAGALGIVCTGGRAQPSIFGKLFGGLGRLYSCVNYLSDILSYSRLLGLGLATGVIAQVMNSIATMGGPTIGGWIACMLIFTVGHIFNVLISIIGTFVHSSRLQFIEFYSKFYESGGRPFAPLFNQTKYVEIN